jgi:hypothetical protein
MCHNYYHYNVCKKFISESGPVWRIGTDVVHFGGIARNCCRSRAFDYLQDVGVSGYVKMPKMVKRSEFANPVELHFLLNVFNPEKGLEIHQKKIIERCF